MKLIYAKFKSRCALTGQQIKRGELCFYDRETKLCFKESLKPHQIQAFLYHHKVETSNADKLAADMIQANENEYFDRFCRSNNI